KHAEDIDNMVAWCCHGFITPAALELVENWISFNLPQKFIATELIELETNGAVAYSADASIEKRDGFCLTDRGESLNTIITEVNHCIYCHDKKGDFCSRGFPFKKSEPEQGYKENALGNLLLGCPLEQKISEMILLKKEGLVIAPLAMIMLDNPMCALTGHRICNDCQKACVYQKQDPVDVPQIESRILKDVLSLPWGVEIYDLLTKWNPLAQKNYLLQPYNGYNVLVMGMGPAGITLAHYLLQQGCAVVGADGLKIEPIAANLLDGPVHSFAELSTGLDERVVAGFGGVAEYGITARWNKNFLNLAYLSLARKQYFDVLGAARFGGSLTIDDAWKLGFDHLAVAVGAGLPKELNIPGSLAKGMRAANDFLMALHLTGAIRDENIASLEVQLPAIIIGGGLTGVDAATELQALYIKQVERTLRRYEDVIKTRGEAALAAEFIDVAKAKLDIFLEHGREVRSCRQRAKAAGDMPNFVPLVKKWGGVTIVYRKKMIESPAYRNNHYELKKALQEGVLYAECCEPEVVVVNDKQHVVALKVKHVNADGSIENIEFAAKNILVATGAKPNVAYAFEHAGELDRSGFQYKLYLEDDESKLSASNESKHCKDNALSFFSSYDQDKRRVTVIGDTNPAFNGSVVKAIASAKQSYNKIIQSMQKSNPYPQRYDTSKSYIDLKNKIDFYKASHVVAINNLESTVMVTIYAPFALRNYNMGNFFRIQNHDLGLDNMFTEPVSVYPAKISADKTSFSCYLEKETAKLLTRSWQIGTKVTVMGPTGVKTTIKPWHQHTLMFLDESQIGPGVLMAKAIKDAGFKVDIIVSLDNIADMYAYEDLYEAANKLALCVGGNAVDCSYSNVFFGKLHPCCVGEYDFGNFNLATVTAVLIKAKADVINDVKELRYNSLLSEFKNKPKTTATVAGPMQCMLKGVCAQCLQWQIDPETGERTKAVYSCSWQEMPLEIIALDHLKLRNDSTDNVVTKLNSLWLDDC
ncbi:MAG: FAD-dependent oxidoreductase, partial [Legionellales bacterium]|nr:FAD-dependent oxidoreductase [Legionellales bacterium]